jgi:predicted acylesterase/phospholipase RssA
MSVQQLISDLRECRSQLHELRNRHDYFALSCALLRLEGAGGTVLYDHPFARVLNDRPFHHLITASQGETFGLAIYPLAAPIESERIPVALAPVEAIIGEIHPLLKELPKRLREHLRLPDSDSWWRIVFHVGWHFPRVFLRPVRCRLLAKDGVFHGLSDETFVQLYGTGGRGDLLPGLIYSHLEHDLCTCSEAALGVMLDSLEQHAQTDSSAPLDTQAISADQRKIFDWLRAEFQAATKMPLPSLECKLLKLADSFDTPPAREWAALEVGGCVEQFLTLSRLNDQQEIVQIRGPATEWFCQVAERAGHALPVSTLDCPVLFDDIKRGFSGPRPVMNRSPVERWVGFVFTTLKRYGHAAFRLSWGTQMGPLSYGLATLDQDLCAASVLAIDLARFTTAAEEAAKRERASCSPSSVPSMEEQGFQWAEGTPPVPSPPDNYTLGQLLEYLRQFGENYHRSAEHIRQNNHPAVQRRAWVELGVFVSQARAFLYGIPGFNELREFAQSFWGQEMSFEIGRRIVDTLVQRSNGSLSADLAEGLTLTQIASILKPAPNGDELPAPTDGNARKQITDALETWKRVPYPHLPGGRLALAELIKLTNRIVAWSDRHANQFDVTPLDEVRRILARRAAGETTSEEELRAAGERAARACDRIKDWLQTTDEHLEVKTSGYMPSTEISRIVFELNNPPGDSPPMPGELVEVPNPFDYERRAWLPILREHIDRIPELAGDLTEEKLRHWLWQQHRVAPTQDLTADQLMLLLEREQAEPSPAKPEEDLVLALSGGGLRATLFHLGIFVYLAHTKRLENVKEIVSVSGGSILAAHFGKDWQKAIRDAEGFTAVASTLVKFARSNVRDSVLIPWLWSRLLLCWRVRKLGRTARLEQAYRKHFGEITIPHYPRIVFVATDSMRQERIAFMSDRVQRFPMDKKGDLEDILTKGIHLSVAVAASSCFPPVFSRMHLKHADLGINFCDFKETLSVNDGGVTDNLGIQVLRAIQPGGTSTERMTYICDAERPQTSKPGGLLPPELVGQGAALSQAQRELLESELGTKCEFICLADRTLEDSGLSFRTQTKLAGFRTDLDAPSWKEINALMLHGAAVAAKKIDGGITTNETQDLIRGTISQIQIQAGGPPELAKPQESDLRRCHKRPKARVLVHIFLVLCAMAMELLLVGFVVLRPLMNWLVPPPPTKDLTISLDYQDAPLSERFYATINIPPYQPITINGNGIATVSIPHRLERIERIAIDHCTGYRQTLQGPFTYGSGVIIIRMKKDTMDPERPPPDGAAIPHLPPYNLVLQKAPVDPQNVTFYYRNNTDRELKLWIFSGWRYVKFRQAVERMGDPKLVFDVPKEAWVGLPFPAQSEYQVYDFDENSTNGWCCFFVKDRDHENAYYLGCHNLFADKRPKLDVTVTDQSDQPYRGQFIPMNTFGVDP